MARGKGRRRRGFIIFFGHRTLYRDEPTPAVDATCPTCRATTRMRGRFAQPWFTFFFVPIFPLQARTACSRFAECGTCRGRFASPIEAFARRGPASPANDHASAIRLYNELRDRPDDSATMLKLIAIYAAMNEPREAESSARAFPIAFANDPRCRAALEKMGGRPPT